MENHDGGNDDLHARIAELERQVAKLRSEQQRNELREKQWRILNTAISHSPDFVYLFDLDGRFTFMNPALCALWQRSFEESVGLNFFELGYPPELAGRLQRQIQEVIETRHPVRDQTPYTGAEGTVGFYEYIFVPVIGPAGVECVAGSTRDITERVHSEAQLRESQRRFHQLANAMPQIVWTATPDGALDYTNERLEEYSGLSCESAFGAGWLVIVHPDDQESTIARWKRSLLTGERYETEFRLKSALGEWRTHLVRADPVREDGRIIRWFGTCTDIQGEKDIALELKRSNDELAIFAHVAAHDLQSPVSSIKNLSQLLQRRLKGQVSEDCENILQSIVDGGTRMSELVQGLLRYALVGQGDPVSAPVDMKAVVREALKNVEPLMSATEAEVSLGEMASVVGDGVQLQELFENLLSNAIKYRREEAPRIEIVTERIGSDVAFVVKDNGQGIAEEYQEKIFRPLERLHGHDIPGTGIGLAICQKIVERHRGRIWVNSTVGEGSAFYFTIPSESQDSSVSE